MLELDIHIQKIYFVYHPSMYSVIHRYIKGNKSFDDGVLVDHFEVVRFIKESDGVGASIVMRHHLNRALEYLKNK